MRRRVPAERRGLEALCTFPVSWAIAVRSPSGLEYRLFAANGSLQRGVVRSGSTSARELPYLPLHLPPADSADRSSDVKRTSYARVRSPATGRVPILIQNCLAPLPLKLFLSVLRPPSGVLGCSRGCNRFVTSVPSVGLEPRYPSSTPVKRL